MMPGSLEIVRWLRIGAPVHAVSICADASHLLVGSDGALTIFTRHGDVSYRYADRTGELSFRLVRLAPDMRGALAVQRTGEILALTLNRRGAELVEAVHQLRWEAHDIYSVSWSSPRGRIALGHYGPALSVLNSNGALQWRRHPDDGNATNGRLWSVALDASGDRLYVGAAGAAANLLATVDAGTGAIGARTQLAARITQLALLPAPLAVAAILNTGEDSRVSAFDALLRAPAWETPAADSEVFTCLDSAPGAEIVVVTSNIGAVCVLNARNGEPVAPPLVLESAILSLSITPDGSQIAVGLTDGRVALLSFIAPTQDVEVLDL